MTEGEQEGAAHVTETHIEFGLATTSMHREAISDIYFERNTTVNKVLSIPCVLTYYNASCMKYGTLYGKLSCKFILCHAIYDLINNTEGYN